MKDNPNRNKLHLYEYNQYGKYFDISERKELIGEALTEARKLFGLSQSELADLLGIKAGTYSTYEKGTREAPAEIIVRLSILYNIPTDVLLQTTRFRYENFISIEQFNQLDKELDELREFAHEDKELNPEFKAILETMADAFGTMTEQLKEINEKAVPKGQE